MCGSLSVYCFRIARLFSAYSYLMDTLFRADSKEVGILWLHLQSSAEILKKLQNHSYDVISNSS